MTKIDVTGVSKKIRRLTAGTKNSLSIGNERYGIHRKIVNEEVDFATQLAKRGQKKEAAVVARLASTGKYAFHIDDEGHNKSRISLADYTEVLKKYGIDDSKLLKAVRLAIRGMKVKSPTSRILGQVGKDHVTKCAVLGHLTRVLVDNPGHDVATPLYEKLAGKPYEAQSATAPVACS